MNKVSIIVPIYNVEKYLEKCLDSLIGQTYENIELILVNDGSTDRSLEIAERYANKHKQIRLVTQKNGGLSKARNTGIKLAGGEYLCFVDSDDWLEVEAVEKVTALMEKDNLDLCLFGAKGFISDENGLNRQSEGDYCYSSSYKGVYAGKELLSKLYFGGEFKASACMYLTKRKLILDKRLTFQEGIIHEDELFTPFLFYYAERVELMQNKFYDRRIRENSIVTGTRALEHMRGYGNVFLGLILCPGVEDENSDVAKSYCRLYTDNLQQCLNYYVLLDKEERKKVRSFLRKILKAKKRKGISLPIIYYAYLIKCYILKGRKKK